MIKIIGIGNRLLQDDAIGVLMVEQLNETFSLPNVEYIIGETDYIYCLNEIDESDVVIIIDGSYFNTTPGTVTCQTLQTAAKQRTCLATPHELNLIQTLQQECPTREAYVIGIEISSVDWGIELSPCLQHQWSTIEQTVKQTLLTLLNVEV